MPKAPDSAGEVGTVLHIDGNYAIVELGTQETCSTCGARVLCMPDGTGNRRIRIWNEKGAREGQRVEITQSDSFLLKISAIQYGFPFVGFLSGVFLMYLINKPASGLPFELEMFIGGLVGLALSGLAGRQLLRPIARTPQTVFSILRIL